jgi:hypothetical protein
MIEVFSVGFVLESRSYGKVYLHTYKSFNKESLDQILSKFRSEYVYFDIVNEMSSKLVDDVIFLDIYNGRCGTTFVQDGSFLVGTLPVYRGNPEVPVYTNLPNKGLGRLKFKKILNLMKIYCFSYEDLGLYLGNHGSIRV